MASFNDQQHEPDGVSIDMHSIGGVDNFGFYNSGNYDMNNDQNQINDSGMLTVNASNFGKAGHYLENKGFGWLLEAKEDLDSHTSLLEELDIDLTDIYYKIRCVLLPLPYFRMKLNIVRESPDFWGPLGVVLAFSMLSIYGQISVLSWILTMWFCGGFMVYFIARALGGDVGYSQVLGVIGYCLIPLVCTGFFSSLLSRFHYISSILGMLGVIWSVYSSGTLLCEDELQSKKFLLLYPVFLLYVYFYSLYSGV
ncbi:unnamed protein product [Auanema sp. JU1783]|nr:unnamed protein product [Auanema sp. JU1783]